MFKIGGDTDGEATGSSFEMNTPRDYTERLIALCGTRRSSQLENEAQKKEE